MAKQGHRSDQGAIWEKVRRQQESLGVCSDTMAMSDTFVAYQDTVDDYREKLKYVAGCSGLAVAVGAKVVSIDLFDKPATCEKVWDRVLSGSVLDALETEASAGQAEGTHVEHIMAESSRASWHEAQAVGEGIEFRTGFGGNHGSALCFEDSPVHVSLLAAR